jgi:bifunctional non-homologous end joining protein LigD
VELVEEALGRRWGRGGESVEHADDEILSQRRSAVPLTCIVFDVLSVDGESVASRPYSERRRILEDLRLDGRFWRTPEAFEDGEALWEAVCAHELEGVVAKPRRSRSLPGERGWVKAKNRDYWRWELERVGAFKSRREREFI